MDIKLALMTGIDIPIPEYGITIRQPTLKEISMLGEKEFFIAAQSLCINKHMISESVELPSEIENFEILMRILQEDKTKKPLVQNLLSLLFPKYSIIITPRAFSFNAAGENFIIDKGNFNYLQDYLQQMFCLQQTGKHSFNPQGEKATEIAQKLLRARQRVAAQKASEEGESSLGQYISAITVGISSMSLNDTINLTLYQLYDLLERYNLYVNWDLDIRARLAGATGNKKLENWMRPLQ